MDVAVAHQDTCDPTVENRPPLIEEYEPNVLGYAKQSDDEPFVDITISLKAQLFRGLFCQWLHSDRNRLYLTFTGRFGFYVRDRPSGPVIGKEYNPKLLWRWIPDLQSKTHTTGYDGRSISQYNDYLDFAYAHDSNGQSIDSLAEYQIQSGQVGSARDALDYISRGWDYVGVTAKKTFAGDGWGKGALSVYPDVKFFLRHGFLQGIPEEYHSWEQDSALRPRHAFDGLDALVEYWPYAETTCNNAAGGLFCKSGLRLAVKYTTGYDPVARYNTIRGEVGFLAFGLPLTVWAQDGYMNSLARYYLKARSLGIGLRFAEL